MSEDKEVVRDALDVEAIKLLKADPAKFFESKRRHPFGFVALSSTDETSESEKDT